MRVAMIGSGLQARRRTPILRETGRDTLAFVASGQITNAEKFARAHGCDQWGSWQAAVTRDDIDAVIVCTTPESHAEITIAALRAGKHVLCEKPISYGLDEAEAMIAAARDAGRVLKCGFNHRHHPALSEAKAIVESGRLGRLMTGRCRYGICGRLGYEKEWRADTDRTAGGQLLELGIHVVDLFRWFFGDMAEVACMKDTQYFPIAPLEDNGMMLLRSKAGAMCMMHSSLTQWKNLFSFEIIGEEGYITVEGLGESYGTQTLFVGRRDFEAPFQDLVTHFRGKDRSWALEWKEFSDAVAEGRAPIGDGQDGLEALRIILAGYEAAVGKRTLTLG